MSLQTADLVKLFLEGKAVKLVKWQASEQRYAPVELRVGFDKGSPLIFITALNCRRVLNSPVRGHRLAGPDRAGFRRLIAHCKNKMQERRARSGELTPVLAAQLLSRKVVPLKHRQRQRVHFTHRMAP